MKMPVPSHHKVLHTITGLHTGGAELMLARLAVAMTAHGFTSDVVSLMPEGAVAAPLIDAGVPIHSLGLARGLPSPRAAVRLSLLARRLRPNLVQGWMYHGNLAATWAGLSAPGRPRVVWNVRHSLYDLALESRLTAFLIRLGAKLSNNAAAIIYNSRTSAEQHERLGYSASRSVFIPNGFDCERFRPRPDARHHLRADLSIPQLSILIGMVARNHPMKDAGNLLKAIAFLRSEGLPVHLVVVGRGFSKDDAVASKAVAQCGLDDAVRLLGERRDVSNILPGLDILALPSAWGEGFPNVLGEAMASGVACVATDVGDSRWILGKHGVVVPPRDPRALAGALRQMIAIGPQGRHELGMAGRARVIAEFDLAAVTKAYADLYFDVLANAARESGSQRSAERRLFSPRG